MDSNYFVVLVSVLGTLTGLGALGATGLITGAYVNERAKRQAAESQLDTAERQAHARDTTIAELRADVKHLEFIRGNKLYSRSAQDLDFAAHQSLLRLRVVKADLEHQLTDIERILATAEGNKP